RPRARARRRADRDDAQRSRAAPPQPGAARRVHRRPRPEGTAGRPLPEAARRPGLTLQSSVPSTNAPLGEAQAMRSTARSFRFTMAVAIASRSTQLQSAVFVPFLKAVFAASSQSSSVFVSVALLALPAAFAAFTWHPRTAAVSFAAFMATLFSHLAVFGSSGIFAVKPSPLSSPKGVV